MAKPKLSVETVEGLGGCEWIPFVVPHDLPRGDACVGMMTEVGESGGTEPQ